jgi:hypothetical protein
MKSRLAILLMLVLGMVFSTAGAGLAIQGLGSDDASVSQYGTPTPPPGDVLGEEDESDVGGDVADQEDVTQTPRQVETGSDSELPFTGFLALPVLLGGVALLSAGLVLRRRTHGDRS